MPSEADESAEAVGRIMACCLIWIVYLSIAAAAVGVAWWLIAHA